MQPSEIETFKGKRAALDENWKKLCDAACAQRTDDFKRRGLEQLSEWVRVFDSDLLSATFGEKAEGIVSKIEYAHIYPRDVPALAYKHLGVGNRAKRRKLLAMRRKR